MFVRGKFDYVEEDHNYSSPCWMWQKSITKKGYAACNRNGFYAAHQFYYAKFIGEVPSGMELDHLCKVRSCVNPYHLEVVTHIENIRRSSNPSLSIERSARIREMRRTGKFTIVYLANHFGVSKSAIKRVLNGQYWSKDNLYIAPEDSGNIKNIRIPSELRANSRLNPQIVIQIRECRSRGEQCMSIAKKYGIHVNTIRGVATGRTWKDVVA